MTGQELKEIRRELSWTQVKMAESLGCSQSHYANMERGNQEIREGIARFATVLHLVLRLGRILGLIEPRSPLR